MKPKKFQDEVVIDTVDYCNLSFQAHMLDWLPYRFWDDPDDCQDLIDYTFNIDRNEEL